METDPIREKLSQDSSIEEPAQFDKFWWRTHTMTPLTAIILMIAACGLVTYLFRPLLEPVKNDEIEGQSQFEKDISGAQFIQNSKVLYYVDRSLGLTTTDIFSRQITATTTITPQNLTLSPNYSEFQPVLDPKEGKLLAFFSVSRTGDRSLKVMQPGHVALDITYHSGTSGLSDDCQIELNMPPQWDPEGQWLAFLVGCALKSGQITKLFVANVSGGQVKMISESGYPIVRVSWQDAQTLIYSEQRPSRSEAIFQISISNPTPQPTLISTVVAAD